MMMMMTLFWTILMIPWIPVECVSLNTINITPMPFIISSDILLWNPSDDNPFLDSNNNTYTVQVLHINSLKFTSDQLAKVVELLEVVAIEDDATPTADEPTTTGVNAVTIDENDTIADTDQICGQFEHGANATVTNFLVDLCEYKAYDHKFKCPVKLTGAIGFKLKIYPLGEGYYLYVPAPVSCGYLVIS